MSQDKEESFDDQSTVDSPRVTINPVSARIFSEGEILAGRFRIVSFLARGGMGEVYEAEDLELQERVALKTIRRDAGLDDSAIERFRREIQLSRKVTHPNVCRIFDVFHHSSSGTVVTLIQ